MSTKCSSAMDMTKISLMYCTQLTNKYCQTFFRGHLKKHNPMLLNERSVQEHSKMFFFLPSMTDRKEKINQFFKNVSLHPIDCHYEDFQKFLQQTDTLGHRTLTYQIWKGGWLQKKLL